MLLATLLLAISSSRAALSDNEVSGKSIVEHCNPVVGGDSEAPVPRKPNYSDFVADERETVKLVRNTELNKPSGEENAGVFQSLSKLEGWKKYVVVGVLIVLLLTSCFGVAIAASIAACSGSSNAYCRQFNQAAGTANGTEVGSVNNGTEIVYNMNNGTEAVNNGTEIAYNMNNGSEAVNNQTNFVRNMSSNVEPNGAMQNDTGVNGTMAVKNFKRRAIATIPVLEVPTSGNETMTTTGSMLGHLCSDSELVNSKITFKMGTDGSVIPARQLLDGEEQVLKGIRKFVLERFLSTPYIDDADITILYLHKVTGGNKIKMYQIYVDNFARSTSRTIEDLSYAEKDGLAKPAKLYKIKTKDMVGYCTDQAMASKSVCVIFNPEDAKKYSAKKLSYNTESDKFYVKALRCANPLEK